MVSSHHAKEPDRHPHAEILNLPGEGLVGQQLFAGEATRLAYGGEEAVEGRDAFLEKRPPNYAKFPWHY